MDLECVAVDRIGCALTLHRRVALADYVARQFTDIISQKACGVAAPKQEGQHYMSVSVSCVRGVALRISWPGGKVESIAICWEAVR